MAEDVNKLKNVFSPSETDTLYCFSIENFICAVGPIEILNDK